MYVIFMTAAAAASAAAEALRLQGNDAFGAARYEEAVGLYTDALGHAPRSAALYANRALALLKRSGGRASNTKKRLGFGPVRLRLL